MTEHATTTLSAVDRFWDRFIDRARKSGVKEPAIRWRVRRAEQYLNAFSGKRLAEHSVQDVTGYLEGIGRIGGIADWQFVQVVDAVENLLLTAGAPVARELDWGYWRDWARTLATDHPTIAREGGWPEGSWRNRSRVPPYGGWRVSGQKS